MKMTPNLKDLNRNQRDALLAQLLAEREHDREIEAFAPASAFGKHLLSVAKDMLAHSAVDGHVADISAEADGAVEVGFEDALCWHLDEISWAIADDIHTAVLDETTHILARFDSDLIDAVGIKLGDQLLTKLLEGIDLQLSSEAFDELKSELAEGLSYYVQESFSWRCDTSRLTAFVEEQVASLLNKAILPSLASNICTAEVELAPEFDELSTLISEEE